MKRAHAGLLLVLGAVVAHAQTPSTPTFGVVAGLNFARLSGDSTSGTKQRIGFVGGATLNLPISPNWAFAPELVYSQKGVKASDTDFNATIKLSYIELPVLFRYDFGTAGGVRPFLLAGPALALKTGCSFEVESGGVSLSGGCDSADDGTGETTSFKSFDVGAMFGGGLSFDVGGRTMRLGVHYNFGLVEIADGGDAKNRVLSLVGSFEWPFHK